MVHLNFLPTFKEIESQGRLPARCNSDLMTNSGPKPRFLTHIGDVAVFTEQEKQEGGQHGYMSISIEVP